MEILTDFKSSNVKHVAYDQKAGELQVEFKNGGRYSYIGVTPKRWHELKSAKSVGGFVAQKINGKYESRRLGAKQK